MPEIVGVSMLKLLNNELGVKQDKATEYDQAKVQLKLKRGGKGGGGREGGREKEIERGGGGERKIENNII